MSLIVILIGLLMVGYSFVADLHLVAHWSDIVGLKAGIADVGTPREREEDKPKNAILMTFHHDWMVIRFFGIATSVVGFVELVCERRKRPLNTALEPTPTAP